MRDVVTSYAVLINCTHIMNKKRECISVSYLGLSNGQYWKRDSQPMPTQEINIRYIRSLMNNYGRHHSSYLAKLLVTVYGFSSDYGYSKINAAVDYVRLMLI